MVHVGKTCTDIALVAATGTLFSSVPVFSDLKEEQQVVRVIELLAEEGRQDLQVGVDILTEERHRDL